MLKTTRTTPSPLDQARRRRGVSAAAATSKSGRRLSVHEQELLQEILAKPMDYIDSEVFRRPDAFQVIYDDAPSVPRPDVTWYRPLMDDLTPQDGTVRGSTTKSNGTVLLTAAQERVLFLQYNYARFRIREIQETLGTSGPSPEEANEILDWYDRAMRLRQQIAETNLALVLAMAKRTRMSEVDFADMVSEGNMALLRSVDKFDCGRGFKFSTYACRAILKAFSRQGMKFTKYRQRFPTDFDPSMEKSNHLETVRETFERESADEVKHIVLANDAGLSRTELTVIHHRFGVGDDGTGREAGDPLTLEQVGQIIGVTKERVRQIQNKALEKIRLRLEASDLAPSEREAVLQEMVSPN